MIFNSQGVTLYNFPPIDDGLLLNRNSYNIVNPMFKLKKGLIRTIINNVIIAKSDLYF